jgi:hypothetical protein
MLRLQRQTQTLTSLPVATPRNPFAGCIRIGRAPNDPGIILSDQRPKNKSKAANRASAHNSTAAHRTHSDTQPNSSFFSKGGNTETSTKVAN